MLEGSLVNIKGREIRVAARLFERPFLLTSLLLSIYAFKMLIHAIFLREDS